MARTQIPISTTSREGVVPANQVTASDVIGLYIANNQGETLIEIVNKHASNIGRVGFEFFDEQVDDVVVQNKYTDAIPAGGTVVCGPFPTQYYSREDLSVYVNPVAGSAASLWFRGYEMQALG